MQQYNSKYEDFKQFEISENIFQAPNKQQKLNQNKLSFLLPFFIIFNHLSVV